MNDFPKLLNIRIRTIIFTFIMSIKIVCIGNAETVTLFGSVNDNWWAPVSDATIAVVYDGREVQVNTDEKGQYEVILKDIQTSINSSVNNPVNFTLYQNFPNPFNPTTTIHFILSNQEYVRLNIYNITGQLVRRLVDEKREAGTHYVMWDGTDDSGIHVSTGVYFYRVEVGKAVQTRKMVLLDGGSNSNNNIFGLSNRASKPSAGNAIQITISIETLGHYPMTETVIVPVTDNNVFYESTIKRILPEGIDDNDMRFVLGKAMEMALDPMVISDSVISLDTDSIYVSTQNVDVSFVPEIQGKNIVFLSPDEIQEKADTEGDFPYYAYDDPKSAHAYIEITSEKTTLSMRLIMAAGKNSPHFYLWGGGYTADFIRKEDNTWNINIYARWISKISSSKYE